MIELGLIMAKILPSEVLIEELEERLKAYKITESKEDYQKFVTCCIMIAMKEATEHEGMESILEKIDRHKRLDETFDKKN